MATDTNINHEILLTAGYQEIFPQLNHPSIKLYRLPIPSRTDNNQLDKIANSISTLVNENSQLLKQKIPDYPYICKEADKLSLLSFEQLGDTYMKVGHHLEAMAIYERLAGKIENIEKVRHVHNKIFSGPHRQLYEEYQAVVHEFKQIEENSKRIECGFKLGYFYHEMGSKAQSPTYLNQAIKCLNVFITRAEPESESDANHTILYLITLKKLATAHYMLKHTETARVIGNQLNEDIQYAVNARLTTWAIISKLMQ